MYPKPFSFPSWEPVSASMTLRWAPPGLGADSKAQVLRESPALVTGRVAGAAGRIAQVDLGPPLPQRRRRFKKLARGDRHQLGLQ